LFHYLFFLLSGGSAERGGSISIASESTASIRESQFEGHSALYEAGAIYVAEKSELSLYNSSFLGK